MAQFRYQALNAQQQPVAGELEAESVSQALARLEASGLSVQSIGYATAETRPPAHQPATFTPRETTAEQAVLALHLERAIERSRPIAPALRALAEELPAGPERRQLATVIRILEAGNTAEATSAVRKLPTYWIPLLSAAGASSDPGRILAEFLNESQRADELRRQWWLTLAYPLLVSVAAAIVLIFLSFFVIPIFRDIFAGFGLKLPAITRVVLTLVAWITSGQILIALAAFALAVFIAVQAAQLLPPAFRDWIGDRFGTPLGRSTAIARFSQFLADLLEAESDPAKALRVAGFASDSPRLRRAAWRLASDIESGDSARSAAYESRLTATVLHALRSEMPTATRVRLLREVSRCHGARAREQLSWTGGVVEPIAITCIGAIVGATVIALFLPLFQLIHALA